SWDNGLGSGSSHVVSPSTTTLYKVTGSIGSCQVLDSILVTVNDLPTVVTNADTAICSGNSVTLSASGANSYTWNQSLGNGSSHVVGPISNTLYIVNGTSTEGCTSADSALITVHDLPQVQTNNDTAICEGQQVVLTATGASTYSWNQAIGSGNTKTVSPASQTLYIVTGVDANACQNLDSVIVSVNANPVLSTSNDTTICAENTLTISASGANTFTWDNGLGAGASHTITPNTTTNYHVQGQNLNGCTASDSVLVTVLSLPNIIAGPDQSLCSGSSTTVQANGGNSYVWSNGVTDGVSFTPSNTATYVVIGTGANGCENSDSLEIQVLADLAVEAGNDTTICDGASITLTGSGAVNYSWSNGVSNGVAFTPNSTETYYVTGTDNSGCSGMDSITVSIQQNPTFQVSNDTSICFNGFANISATGPLSFTWNNGLGSGPSHSVSPFTTTNFQVKGTEDNGSSCTNSVQDSQMCLP
ncbi:unnamed protein product, partial [Chrysoparadoxa australica]